MLPETFYAPTDDGWRLALHHWPSKGSRRHPVLMVHGLGANRLNFDLDDRHSLARAARARGYDVYVLELRGAGLSISPGGQDRFNFQWGFGDYSQVDLPVAVQAVLDKSGAQAVHGVGHSMGGMLFYSLGVRQPKSLKSITAVGAPLVCELDLAPRERRLLKVATRLAPQSSQRRVPMRRLMGVAGRFVPIASRLVDGLLLNAQNTDPDVMGRMAREAINDVPLKLVLELTHQMANGKNAEGPYAYEQHLDRINVPVFAMGGSADRIAPPQSVAAAVARLAATDVRYREMGRKFGDSADYGHVDLLVGKNAPDEVFPLLLDFLDEVD
jgi:pimeloyl-ACP methyl ester carboxylesterase